MIKLGNTLLSDDIKERLFVCDLQKCKGACCVEGDMGAPLEEGELDTLDQIYPVVKEYMSEKGKQVVEAEGCYEKDPYDSEYVTTTVNNRECVFAYYDDQKVLKCAIESAYFDKKIDFRKPISCHLYPIRVKKYDEFYAVNYDAWDICNDACKHGKELGVPLYKFLKEPLQRKFGEDWYKKLVELIEHR